MVAAWREAGAALLKEVCAWLFLYAKPVPMHSVAMAFASNSGKCLFF
jgi:hypothetical protein